MGYFNYFIKCVIRKIVNFIFNKKNFFKFCCILFFIFCVSKIILQTPISYGATTIVSDTTYYDGYIANRDLYDALQNDLIVRMSLANNPTLEAEVLDRLNNTNYVFCAFYSTNSSNINSLPVDKYSLNLFIFDRNILDKTVSSKNWNNNGFVNVSDYVLKESTTFYYFEDSLLRYGSLPAGYSFSFPSYLVNYKSDELTNYILSYYDNSDDELQDIIQESTNTIVQSNQQTQNTIKEQTNTIKEQTDFLTNNTVSDSSISLPTDNSQDNTGVDDEINFIFDDIMNAFTDTSNNNYIRLTFPFTNQTFDISYATVYNGVFENNNSMAYLKRIIQLGYWYIVAVFVIKDISNKVNKVKTGDIDKIQTGNIKEDLL